MSRPRPHILRAPLTLEDDSWRFTVPNDFLRQFPRTTNARNQVTLLGKCIRFTVDELVLKIEQFPYNRILHTDVPSKFILCSFGDLRFKDTPLRTTGEYITRVMKEGLWLNGVQYRFYGHSNSQLRGRSCFLREASNDEELDARIYQMGDFGRIMNVAKRAKRIGLLLSEAQIDFHLNPQLVEDIDDIKMGDELFSDGCGLMSKKLAVHVSRLKKIIFRLNRYTPCVFQIRYLGYKGVLMLHPDIDKANKDREGVVLAQFRKSMKKFSTTANDTFSVVDYSKPYAFGRLNNDVIVLLSSLGITNEKLIAKQHEYHTWISEAASDPVKAFTFLSSMEEYGLAQKVLLDGLDDPAVQSGLRSRQLREVASFKGEKNGKNRARMIIHKSRLLFGVCDPYGVLKEGEVHIRITTGRGGAATPIHGDVLVVRNPCLHPGDCLKLRAAHHNELSHLVDCIVFASVAKPGRHAAPSMSSGGDLDGDKYFVCWDPDLVPARVAESYDYPPNKERASRNVTRMDLATHFASYNNAGLARVAALHSKWVASHPKGALSSECQELNALHSQAVDGASVKIPDRLLNPPPRPEGSEPFVLHALAEHALAFAEQYTQDNATRSALSTRAPADSDLTQEDREQLLLNLLQSRQNTVSEYELFELAWAFTRRYNIPLKPYMAHFDFSALTAQQKHAILALLGEVGIQIDERVMWNSLFRSDILSQRELYQRCLDHPFKIQRLYSSKMNGLTTFFEYLKMATQEYTRKLLILKTDDRFSVGIFMRGDIAWDEDPTVGQNVVVCSFLPESSDTFSTYRPCTVDYKLHCSDLNLQLYNKNRGDTFVFLAKAVKASGAELQTSIALQKFSARVQKQLGRLFRTPVVAIELHVVSNRDRISHQLFDLWFEHIPTEERVRRFERERTFYRIHNVSQIQWNRYPAWMKDIFVPKRNEGRVRTLLADQSLPDLDRCMDLALSYHAEDELFWIYTLVASRGTPLQREWLITWIDVHPPLAYVLLKLHPPDEDSKTLPDVTRPFRRHILQNIIRSANHLGIAALVALEKLSGSISESPVEEYFNLLWLTAQSVRSPQLTQEVLLVLNDSRAFSPTSDTSPHPPALRYGHIHALGIAFDRAEEAADECPCDESGKPRRTRGKAPYQTTLTRIPEKALHVKASIRVDSPMTIRLHSHVRLQAASKPEKGWVAPIVMDGVVVAARKGELEIELMHPPPPEMDPVVAPEPVDGALPVPPQDPQTMDYDEEEFDQAGLVDWNLYDAGSTATSRAMMDALTRLMKDKSECCGFYDIITSNQEEHDRTVPSFTPILGEDEHIDGLNPSQEAAIRSCTGPLSLIWGPPGTGKTTVIVQILRGLVTVKAEDARILMTASTHNAVDNVLERFVEMNKRLHILREEQILRVATDMSKVNKDLQSFTIDARVGGDMNENNKLFKKAKERLDAAVVVFTTCAGAGLGILRKADFEIALIDEASQINEPTALIPLVKGVQRAILVGDHVQLRPTVKKMGKILEFDVSLLERLYTKEEAIPGLNKAMLDIQYRFPQELAVFPSNEFYEGRLRSGIQDSQSVLQILGRSNSEEDMGGRSKSNVGQVELIQSAVKLLKEEKESLPDGGEEEKQQFVDLKITVLTPYNKQITELRRRLPNSVVSSTVDSFQGRESDIVIFSSVRSNAEKDIGFVDDARRLNVMWTRAKKGLILVGDRATMENNEMWKRAIGACKEVTLPSQEGPPVVA